MKSTNNTYNTLKKQRQRTRKIWNASEMYLNINFFFFLKMQFSTYACTFKIKLKIKKYRND